MESRWTCEDAGTDHETMVALISLRRALMYRPSASCGPSGAVLRRLPAIFSTLPPRVAETQRGDFHHPA